MLQVKLQSKLRVMLQEKLCFNEFPYLDQREQRSNANFWRCCVAGKLQQLTTRFVTSTRRYFYLLLSKQLDATLSIIRIWLTGKI